MMHLIRETFFNLRVLDIADMAMVAALLWSAMVLLRRTRARMALSGLAILGVVYLFARQLGLRVTAGILQGFFAVLIIVVVVVFQEDLRRFFEQIGSWGLRRRPRTLRTGMTDLLVRTVAHLAATRTGALLVIPGTEDLGRHVEGGIALNGELSEPILLSLFDASSPGHDGAAILRGSEVERFAVHLPLSSDHAQLKVGGTRHAAALGLAERTDALCVVVSEERGKVSVASHGVLRTLERPEELADELGRFLQDTSPERQSEPLWRRFRGVWKEASISILLAALLWVMFVPGSSVTAVTHRVPVVVNNLPRGYALEGIDPPEIEVTLEGRRRDVYLVNRASLGVRLDALLVKLGRRTFEITPASLEHPPSLTVVRVVPEHVRLSVLQEEEKGAQPSPAPVQ
jgi:uncharacterized protein (TIGR00159 family)